MAKLRYIHGAAVAKIGYSSISAFATRPGRQLIGSVDRFYVCCYCRTHISYTHTFLTTCIKQWRVQPGTLDYRPSSTFYGDKRGVHQGFGSPQTQYQSVEHYLQLMQNPITYATHTEVVAANQFIIVQHPRMTGIGWSALPIATKCKHM